MRPLTDEETKIFFEKLSKYIGSNIKHLLQRPDGTYCFRLQKDRVYYLSESMLKSASNFSKESLVSLGTKFGKFTHSKQFHLHITCLEYVAQYAKSKVWVKPGAEMAFLYGNHVTKSGLGRMTDDTEQYAGVVVYSMSNIPLGFGICAQTTQICQEMEATAYVVLHQADIGEYLRDETTLI